MENSDFVLSIVIPCYNEKDNIKKIVEKVIESPVKNNNMKILGTLPTCSNILIYTLFFIFAL